MQFSKPQKTIQLNQIQLLIETNITIVINCFTKVYLFIKNANILSD